MRRANWTFGSSESSRETPGNTDGAEGTPEGAAGVFWNYAVVTRIAEAEQRERAQFRRFSLHLAGSPRGARWINIRFRRWMSTIVEAVSLAGSQ
jgi:hypothetical protein